MTAPLYDWSRVLFAGPWIQEDAQAFARRVEEIAQEEAEKKLQPTPEAS